MFLFLILQIAPNASSGTFFLKAAAYILSALNASTSSVEVAVSRSGWASWVSHSKSYSVHTTWMENITRLTCSLTFTDDSEFNWITVKPCGVFFSLSLCRCVISPLNVPLRVYMHITPGTVCTTSETGVCPDYAVYCRWDLLPYMWRNQLCNTFWYSTQLVMSQ